MPPTIKDIARIAGVPISAVSYALNGTGPVGKERKEKILKIADELGYVPSGIARSLKRQKRGMFGYFAYNLTGPLFGPVLEGIESVFAERKRQFIACSISEERQITRMFTERMVDGAIIFTEFLADTLLEKLAYEGFPMVVLDRKLTNEHISSILIDNCQGAYKVGKCMKEKGIGSVGFIGGGGFDGKEREKGFLQAVQDFSLNLDSEWVKDGFWIKQVTYETVRNQLKESKPPEAIFCFSDEMARGCIEALREQGFGVPEDVQVIGMDDILLSAYEQPTLTTVKRPKLELGKMAAETLLDMVDGKPSVSRVLATELIFRESFPKV